jgi:hypothetical protein
MKPENRGCEEIDLEPITKVLATMPKQKHTQLKCAINALSPHMSENPFATAVVSIQKCSQPFCYHSSADESSRAVSHSQHRMFTPPLVAQLPC